MVKKILLITFYWPPAGGPGVHRWLRFSKYFKENNCELTVYCPENAAWPVIDESLNSEVSEDLTVIRRKVFEPHKYLQKKAGFEGGAGIGTKTNKLGFIKKMMIWTRGNLFIPDARRFWINPSYRFLKNYLKENPDITHIISTGPPHSMHVIALKLKKQFPKLHWTADFRDPWTEIDYYQELLPGKFADKMQKKLELSVLQNADLVLSIGEDCAKGLQRIGGRKVEIITNGFIFPEFDPKQIELDSKFSIAHFGSMAASRNPVSLWKALRLALQENSKLKEYLNINLYGSVDFSITEDIAKYELTDFYTGPKQVSHKESITLQQRTQLLLLVANKAINSKGILTGKFFEYLGAKRPMLVIGESDSDLEKIVLETNSGKFFEYEEVESLKHYILTSFEQFLNQNLYSNPINIEQFHSKTLTRKIIELIK